MDLEKGNCDRQKDMKNHREQKKRGKKKKKDSTCKKKGEEERVGYNKEQIKAHA